MASQQPVLVLALGNEDASSAMAGILWLKGCIVFKAKSAADCLRQIKNLESKVEVVIASSEIALDRDSMLIMNVKKMDFNIKILVIGDENSDKTMILDYGADEFTLKPLSPENAADKVLMLLARDKVAENRSP
jgi:DNA-binding NarL/FixJ family response regulator